MRNIGRYDFLNSGKLVYLEFNEQLGRGEGIVGCLPCNKYR